VIYFENYRQGGAGLNNHIIPYTLCISLSNFLGRDFFFDFERPSSYPPDYAANSGERNRFEILMKSPRSLVSDLVKIPNRRVYEIDRDTENKLRLKDLFLTFLTTEEQKAKYGNTMIWNFFSLGRKAFTREHLQAFDLVEIGNISLVNATYFYFLPRTEKNELLDSIKIRFRDDIEELAAKVAAETGAFNSIHLRLGDFRTTYGSDGAAGDMERFAKYFDEMMPDKDTPLLVATDGLHEKALFEKLLKPFKYRFIDEIIFDEYRRGFGEMEFTDFNALSVLNEILCANSEVFIGTCRSTFTSIIHRLRQERHGRADFNFVPDERIMRLLTPDNKIKTDGAGFFEWNRYSIFSEHYTYPAWMREWNYNLTSLSE
jgi:hypothetical protein